MKQIFLAFCLLFAMNMLIAADSSQSENIDLDDEELSKEISDIVNNAANIIKASTAQSGSSCFCSPQMTAFITLATDLITKPLKEQMASLKKLKKTIKQHNQTMDEQNNQLNKKLNLLKEETLRNREMLFYLKQKNNLQ